jgi:uncharacterized protein (DUF488 family)
MPPPIYTIGHSTRSTASLLALLKLHRIALLADVRSVPRSARHPHFNSDALAGSLAAARVGYRHFPALGGRRTARADSVNLAFRDGGFRGYADYMASPAFIAALAQLRTLAQETVMAIMCAEADPTQCHRGLIADALAAAGTPVIHIISAMSVSPHRLQQVCIVDGIPTYPPRQGSLL